MAIHLNHTIVSARDPEAAAKWVAELLGLPAPVRFGPFHGVETHNGVTLDYIHDGGTISSRHFAFIVSEAEFDTIYGRIQARGLPHWADPTRQQAGRINHHDGGRGVYWLDPDGHLLEILTRPYGSGGPSNGR
jgi:catechol 2,3-dioxygenase-like lactoylglutathione lyase family enzyme